MISENKEVISSRREEKEEFLRNMREQGLTNPKLWDYIVKLFKD